MQLKEQNPRQSLNKAFLKIKPNRLEIELFKSNLIQLLERINDLESEEFHKNLIANFLKETYYGNDYFINTKGRNDQVIHNGNSAKSSVGVIIEAKKAANRGEMVTTKKLNTKSFQELVLYYLRERITHKNLEVKNLVITNSYEWFIFDANVFERLFANNKPLIKQFEDFQAGRLSGVTTDFFYSEIARPFIDQISQEVEFTYFDIRDYQRTITNTDSEDDKKLIGLFKLLSPQHLLKLPFANDSNSLDKRFYAELLHIIGLTETKRDGKRVIERNDTSSRNSGSILEDTIIQLDSLDKINRLNKPMLYGDTLQERLFNVALALNITWINRILFLKLLEAQLITYHKGDKGFSFLNQKKIKEYDDLNSLFFQVLAKRHEDRNDDVKKLFETVPYLNSSLFEPTEIEHQTIFISNLKDEKTIPILSTTVLKDGQGKKKTGNLSTLAYLFEFLDAYDFSSEGAEEIQEDNKTLINASVLGLIFEKINGYKDGSFFTPGLVTMYMCKETLRRAVLQRFNQTKDWNCTSFDELYNKIDDKKEANHIVNSIKICDPAVGSGHFLVSALNELIAIKNDLKILQDRNGKLLRDYHLTVENDELIITDEDGRLFQYAPNNPESQRVQETLFNEKQLIIENCLFGVDLNPNSVKICRLRLWIELLKNAYYKSRTELETLPNIDINIKNGNSLISRFPLESDIKTALKGRKITIEDYKNAVSSYKNAKSKEEKRGLEQLIEDIKADFRTEISRNSKENQSLNKLRAEHFNKYGTNQLFEESLTKAQVKDKKTLEEKIGKLEEFIQEIKSNKIYENAFEWRFEFPEVLDENGDFIGFDAIIGNPPYIQLQKLGAASDAFEKVGYDTFVRSGDIYSLFYELGHRILRQKGILTFITSNKWMRAAYGESLRNFFVEKADPLFIIDFGGAQMFDTATVDTNILMFLKDSYSNRTLACTVKEKTIGDLGLYVDQFATSCKNLTKESWVILSPIEESIKAKIEAVGTPLKSWDISINYGIKTGFNDAFIIDGKKRAELIEKDPKSDEIIRPLLRGRDMKKFGYQFADLYIIATFPSLKIDIELYPAIKQHLMEFGYDRLKQTGDKGARKKTNNKWFETQDSINYWDDFSRQKIVYPDIMRMPSKLDQLNEYPYIFLDEGDFYVEATNFMMTGENIDVIYLFMTSDIGFFSFSKFYAGPQFDNTGFRYKKVYLEESFVPVPDDITTKALQSALADFKTNEYLGDRINSIWADFLNFTQEETEFVENYKTQLLVSNMPE